MAQVAWVSIDRKELRSTSYSDQCRILCYIACFLGWDWQKSMIVNYLSSCVYHC